MAKRILTLALAVAVGLVFALPAMAEVKSVKVGGDLVIRAIYRDNLGFMADDATPGTFLDDGNQTWIMSTVRVWIGAELSDNASVLVRLINERDWDAEIERLGSGDNIDLDLAQLKVKDLWTPGLSATLGRQEILLGRGFVIGNVSAFGNVSHDASWGLLRALDLTARKAFDAWRVDYEVGMVPLTFTLFGVKVDEDARAGLAILSDGEDWDLMGLNVCYKRDNVTVEGYAISEVVELTGDDYDIWVLGARVDHNVLAVPGLNYNIEAALETGDATTSDMDAWAGNADVSYTFQNQMQPRIGASWFFATGQDDSSDSTAWDPLFPDGLADRVGPMWHAFAVNSFAGAPDGTDQSVPKIYGSFKPAEKHTLSLAYYPDTTENEVGTDTADDLAWEVDLGYTYQYTEDVTVGVTVGYIEAGERTQNGLGLSPSSFDDTATQVIASAAVAF